jgi:serine/threonine protein kinase
MELLGDYTVHKTLKTSLYGRVELATHTATGLLVAIKLSQKSAATLTELQREAQIMRALCTSQSARDRHVHGQQHVLQLLDVLQDEHQFALVLEYCPNGELFEVLQKSGRFSEKKARRFMTQLVAGLQFVHARGFVHLDVSLENIVLDAAGDAKLIDFGLARKAPFCYAGRPGGVGKAQYMAPELFEGLDFDGRRCDVWALGVVLFCMVTGNAPFRLPVLSDPWFRVIYGGDLAKAIARKQMYSHLSNSLVDLLTQILAPRKHRLTLEKILGHPWMLEGAFDDSEPDA